MNEAELQARAVKIIDVVQDMPGQAALALIAVVLKQIIEQAPSGIHAGLRSIVMRSIKPG